MHEINSYITKRYDRWLDYSKYHCANAGIPDEAIDVLNEVLCSLLQKDRGKLLSMLNAKSNGYTELDFFVLRMIKLNASSPTSPYRSKYKSLPSDENVEYFQLELEDVPEEAGEDSEVILSKMRQVREVYENLDLSPLAAKVFEYRFFHELPFSEWEGAETLKELYDIYNGVQDLIRKKIRGESIF